MIIYSTGLARGVEVGPLPFAGQVHIECIGVARANGGGSLALMCSAIKNSLFENCCKLCTVLSNLLYDIRMDNQKRSKAVNSDSIEAKFSKARLLVASGLVPVKRACESVGLNRSTYYLFLNKQNAPDSEQSRGGLSTPSDATAKQTEVSLARPSATLGESAQAS